MSELRVDYMSLSQLKRREQPKWVTKFRTYTHKSVRRYIDLHFAKHEFLKARQHITFAIGVFLEEMYHGFNTLTYMYAFLSSDIYPQAILSGVSFKPADKSN